MARQGLQKSEVLGESLKINKKLSQTITEKSQVQASLPTSEDKSCFKFFNEEIKAQVPKEISIPNPRWVHKQDFEQIEQEKAGQKTNKTVILEILQKKIDEIKAGPAKEFSVNNTQYAGGVFDDSQHYDGFQPISSTLQDVTQWLEDLDKADTPIKEIIDSYKDDVMLRKVFGMQKGQTDVLENWDLAHKQVLDRNTPDFGQRFRSMKTVYINGMYYFILDSTTISSGSMRHTLSEIKFRDQEPNFTATIHIIKYDPQKRYQEQIFYKQLGSSNNSIFLNSQIVANQLYFVLTEESNDNNGEEQEFIEFKLLSIDLTSYQQGKDPRLVHKFQISKIKDKNHEEKSLVSIIMSEKFYEGLSQCTSLTRDQADALFFETTFFAVSTTNKNSSAFETQIYKLNNSSQPFQAQTGETLLQLMSVVPNCFVMTNSSFNFFEKGSYCFSEKDNLEWQVTESFIGLNGWNNNQRDKITDYFFFEIIESDQSDNLNFELCEINPFKQGIQTFMQIQGNLTNTLVRYFKGIDQQCECGNLNRPNILHQCIPSLITFGIDEETEMITQTQQWPKEVQKTCNTLYSKYMGSLDGLKDTKTQNFVTHMLFDFIQAKFYLIMSYWADEDDQLIFVEIKQPQNNIENLNFSKSELFYSELDRNLLNIFNDDQMVARGGLSKFTISKKISNLFRSQNSIFLTYLDKAKKKKLKLIGDKPLLFEGFYSPTYNIYRRRFDLDECMEFHFDISHSHSESGESEQNHQQDSHGHGHHHSQSERRVSYIEDLNYFYEQSQDKFYDIRLDSNLSDSIQLVIKKYDSEKSIPNKSDIELVAQKVRFIEDDRTQIPFIAIQTQQQHQRSVVKAVWLVIIDLVEFRVVRTININLTNLEKQEIQRRQYQGTQLFDAISLCQSQCCQDYDPYQKSQVKLIKDFHNCFTEKYQVAVNLTQSLRVKVFEYIFLWNEYKPVIYQDKYEIEPYIFQIGQREFVAYNECNVDSIYLLPVIDQQHRIQSTQLLFRGRDQKSIQRIVLDNNFENFNFHTKNFLDFGYKIYRFNQSQRIKVIQIQSRFSDEVLRKKAYSPTFQKMLSLQTMLFFAGKDYVNNEFLSVQIKTLLNMIPYDFVDQQTSNSKANLLKRVFKPIQLLQGLSQIDFVFKNPHQLNQLMTDQGFNGSDYTVMTLLERITHGNEERQDHLRKIGIMCQQKEISYDFHQSNCLERCFSGEDSVQRMNSCDILIESMLKFKQNETCSTRNMLVAVLPILSSSDNKNVSKQYINFFTDVVQQLKDGPEAEGEGDQEFENSLLIRQKLLQDVEDPGGYLPKYMEKPLNFQQLTLSDKQFGEQDLQTIIQQHVLVNYEEKASNCEVEHKYVDLRQINMSLLRNAMNGQKIKSTIQCTESLLSESIATLVNNYFDRINECSVIQQIITNMYQTTTRKYYQTLAIFYFCGFVMPFLTLIMMQIKELDEDQRFYSNLFHTSDRFKLNMCLFTQLIFLWIEGIQLYHAGWAYLKDPWNLIDLFNFICYFIFHYLKLLRDKGPRFLPVGFWQKFCEKERLGIDNIDQVLHHDLDESKLSMIAVAQIVTSLLIMSVLLKIFSFLKVFPSVGSFIQIFYKMMEASKYFTAVFCLWIYAFSLIYMVIGIKVEDPTMDGNRLDYEKEETFAIFLRYIILSFKNSVSGPEDPTDNFWTNLSWEKRWQSPVLIELMNLFVVFVWFAGVYLLLVILLNMQISVISDAYAEIVDKQELFMYQQQAELNQECMLVIGTFPLKYIFYDFLGMKNELDCMIISSQIKDEEVKTETQEVKDTLNDILQFTMHTANFQHQQLQIMSELKDKIHQIEITSQAPNQSEQFIRQSEPFYRPGDQLADNFDEEPLELNLNLNKKVIAPPKSRKFGQRPSLQFGLTNQEIAADMRGSVGMSLKSQVTQVKKNIKGTGNTKGLKLTEDKQAKIMQAKMNRERHLMIDLDSDESEDNDQTIDRPMAPPVAPVQDPNRNKQHFKFSNTLLESGINNSDDDEEQDNN